MHHWFFVELLKLKMKFIKKENNNMLEFFNKEGEKYC